MAKHITLLKEDLDIPFHNEESILEVLIKNDIKIDHSCGGMGSCGTCHIWIRSEIRSLPPRSEVEEERATDLHFKPEERLACQLKPIDKLKIEIPE